VVHFIPYQRSYMQYTIDLEPTNRKLSRCDIEKSTSTPPEGVDDGRLCHRTDRQADGDMESSRLLMCADGEST